MRKKSLIRVRVKKQGLNFIPQYLEYGMWNDIDWEPSYDAENNKLIPLTKEQAIQLAEDYKNKANEEIKKYNELHKDDGVVWESDGKPEKLICQPSTTKSEFRLFGERIREAIRILKGK